MILFGKILNILIGNFMLQHNLKCFKDYYNNKYIMSELEDLPMVPRDQKFVCISFLAKEGDSIGTAGIEESIYTYEQACAQAKNTRA